MVGNTDTLLACIGELAPRYVVGSDPFDIERLGWNITRGESSRPSRPPAAPGSVRDVATDRAGRADTSPARASALPGAGLCGRPAGRLDPFRRPPQPKVSGPLGRRLLPRDGAP